MENVPAALGGRFVREESESAYSASCVPTASITKSPNPHHLSLWCGSHRLYEHIERNKQEKLATSSH